MERCVDNEDLRRQGIGAVASLMGHVAAGTGERMEASKAVVASLSVDGLRAAEEHLQQCALALEDPGFVAMLPPDERPGFIAQRTQAIGIASEVVSVALGKR